MTQMWHVSTHRCAVTRIMCVPWLTRVRIRVLCVTSGMRHIHMYESWHTHHASCMCHDSYAYSYLCHDSYLALWKETSLFLPRIHTHTLSLVSLALFLSRFFSLSLSLTHMHTLTHTLTLMLFLSHTHTHSISLSLGLPPKAAGASGANSTLFISVVRDSFHTWNGWLTRPSVRAPIVQRHGCLWSEEGGTVARAPMCVMTHDSCVWRDSDVFYDSCVYHDS